MHFLRLNLIRENGRTLLLNVAQCTFLQRIGWPILYRPPNEYHRNISICFFFLNCKLKKVVVGIFYRILVFIKNVYLSSARKADGSMSGTSISSVISAIVP